MLMLNSDDILDRTGLETLVAIADGRHGLPSRGTDFEMTTSPRHVVLPEQRPQDPYANCVEYLWAVGAVLMTNSWMPRFNAKRVPWRHSNHSEPYSTGRFFAEKGRTDKSRLGTSGADSSAGQANPELYSFYSATKRGGKHVFIR